MREKEEVQNTRNMRESGNDDEVLEDYSMSKRREGKRVKSKMRKTVDKSEGW